MIGTGRGWEGTYRELPLRPVKSPASAYPGSNPGPATSATTSADMVTIRARCRNPPGPFRSTFAPSDALRTRRVYRASVPPVGQKSATNLPSRRAGCPVKRATAGGSHVHRRPIDQEGAQLYPGSIAAPWTRCRPSARPPRGSPCPLRSRPLEHTGPCTASRPRSTGWSRHNHYGASATGSLALHLLVLLAGPGPSGGPEPSRRCQGCFPPSPAFPGSGSPSFNPAAATV
jgi:hypothetical protein